MSRHVVIIDFNEDRATSIHQVEDTRVGREGGRDGVRRRVVRVSGSQYLCSATAARCQVGHEVR